MTADTVGDVWTYACELTKALASLGVEVTLATMGAPPSTSQLRTIRLLPNARLASSKFALEWMHEPWRDVDAAGNWLLELARGGYDLVHLNGYAHATLPFGLPTIVVAHSCVCTWFEAVRDCAAPEDWAEYRKRVRAGLEAADAVVAPTRAIASAILAAYDVSIAPRVIPNGRDPVQWKPAITTEPFILAVGRLWDEAKGLADLQACAQRVRWPIHVAGPTVAPGREGPIDPMGVNLLGELCPDSLAGWMSRAAIYALPARYEPFGLSVLEAALSGCALVLGDIPSLREVWGDSAVFVRPGDPDALAAALDSLGEDPLRRRALAASARSRALHMTPQRMAAAYDELYSELVDARATEVCA